MTRDNMLREIEAILEMPENTLKGTERLADVPNWDSLTTLAFITAADRSCKIRLRGEQIIGCTTINDLLALVKL